MDLLSLIQARHSVRHYMPKALEPDIIEPLRSCMDACNREGKLHIQLVTNEPKAFTGMLAYGKFSGVENYFALVGAKSDTLDERMGYYGEKLVLKAQSLGLNTCWVGLSYRSTDAYKVNEGEKLVGMIAVGYGAETGRVHRNKDATQVSNVSDTTPEWFRKGVEAALLAPTAINQQKFFFRFMGTNGKTGKPQVKAERIFSLVGYTQIDLGIARLHFEIGAGRKNFEWME